MSHPPPMIAGFSHEEILHEALVAPSRVLVPLPDTRVIERAGWWQIITPSITSGGMNEVICAELPREGGEAILDEALASYQQLGLRFRWSVGPENSASDLPERLARRGLRRREVLVMARATDEGEGTDEGEPHEAPNVEEMSLANLEDCTRVAAEGWNGDAGPIAALHRRMLADPARRNRLFLARCEEIAAATAGYVALDRSAYLVGGVTLPPFRGRGLYRALVRARLRHAAARGLTLATTVAMADTSAPILARLGFTLVSPVVVFVNH